MADSDKFTATVTHEADFDAEVVRSIVQDEIESGDYGDGGYGDGNYGGKVGELSQQVAELTEQVDELTNTVGTKADEETVVSLQDAVDTAVARSDSNKNAIKNLHARADKIESDQAAGSGGGTADLTEQIREVMVDEYGEDLEAALGRILIPARTIGPSPSGTYHEASMWGIDFEVERAAHLGDCNVDAGKAGTFEAVLGTYDGDVVEEVASREIEVEQGVNTVTLDFDVPEAGRYLLTRRGEFPLRRVEWDGWDSSSRSGMTLRGGAKPGDFDRNSYFYYYFNLEIAATADAH